MPRGMTSITRADRRSRSRRMSSSCWWNASRSLHGSYLHLGGEVGGFAGDEVAQAGADDGAVVGDALERPPGHEGIHGHRTASGPSSGLELGDEALVVEVEAAGSRVGQGRWPGRGPGSTRPAGRCGTARRPRRPSVSRTSQHDRRSGPAAGCSGASFDDPQRQVADALAARETIRSDRHDEAGGRRRPATPG